MPTTLSGNVSILVNTVGISRGPRPALVQRIPARAFATNPRIVGRGTDRLGCASYPGMSDNYTDLELAEMHAEGVPCPDDDHAREYYALLDWLDEQLRAQRDL